MGRNKQYKDPEKLVGYAMVGGILLFIGLLIYNIVVYGVR